MGSSKDRSLTNAGTGVSVVLGSYNRLGFLKLTIDSIRREFDLCPFPHEIIVVDGGSSDGTLKWLAKQKDVITILQHNRGEWRGRKLERRSWGYFMNLGFKCARGKYVCMLSDDCLVVPGAIRNGVETFEEALAAGQKVGAAAFYWRNWPEQELFWVGKTFGRFFVNHGLYLTEALAEVGYIDEDYYHFYHADSDLCLRLDEKGYACLVSEDSYIEHHSHANVQVRRSNFERQKEDWAKYLARWDEKFTPMESGEWIYKAYRDESNTCRVYYRPSVMQWEDLKWMIKKLLSS